jgi:NTE family protein
MSGFTAGFAIFQGGGAKGAALAGALETAECDFGCDFSLGVGGTSAGSIIAALYAAGWSATNIVKTVKELDFREFLDGYDLRSVKLATGQAESLLKAVTSRNKFHNWSVAWKSRGDAVSLINHLQKTRGIFSGEAFVKWLDQQLSKHIVAKGKRVTFADLTTPLKIVATDVTSGEIRMFSQVTTSDYPVADAVRASISIPFFFRPHIVASSVFTPGAIGNQVLVDGGLTSNFPAWVFDDEASRLPHFAYAIIGFRLVNSARPVDTSTLLSFVKALYEVGIGAPPLLETRGVYNLTEVNIRTPGVNTFDFEMSNESKASLIDCGKLAANEALRRSAKPSADNVELLLQDLCDKLEALRQGNVTHDLRANIFLPYGRGKAKIFYSWNMNGDPDQDLELNIFSGATGNVFASGETKLFDLAEVRLKALADPGYLSREWRMTTFEHSHVRPTLCSLLSSPIRDNHEKIIGVLSIDSDKSQAEAFPQPEECFDVVEKYARVIGALF